MGFPTTGLVAWFMADVGVTKDGSNRVSNWADQSGNSRDAVQATAANKPLWMPGMVNGKPVLRFEGGDGSREDFLTFATYDPDGLGGMTIYLVSSCSKDIDVATPYVQRAAIFWDETDSWGTLHLTPLQKYVYLRFGTGVPSPPQTLPVKYTHPTSIGEEFRVYTSKMDGVDDFLYVNGIQVLSNAKPTGQDTIGDCENFGNIGRGWDDPSGGEPYTYFPGDIAEVLVYDSAHSDADRETVEGYLTRKYLIPSDGENGKGCSVHCIVSHWDMSTTDPQDIGWRKNGNHGTGTGLVVTTDIVPGIGGGMATEFDGTEYVVVLFDPSLDLNDHDFAIAFWLKPNALAQKYIINRDGEGTSRGWNVQLQADGTIQGRIVGVGATVDFASVGAVTVGEWTFVTVVWDRDGNGSVYLDAELSGVADISGAGDCCTDVDDLVFAGSVTPSGELNGTLDEIILMDAAPTRLQIKDLMNMTEQGRL
jgi:hypothetical protein